MMRKRQVVLQAILMLIDVACVVYTKRKKRKRKREGDNDA